MRMHNNAAGTNAAVQGDCGSYGDGAAAQSAPAPAGASAGALTPQAGQCVILLDRGFLTWRNTTAAPQDVWLHGLVLVNTDTAANSDALQLLWDPKTRKSRLWLTNMVLHILESSGVKLRASGALIGATVYVVIATAAAGAQHVRVCM